jgi:glycosyltransferase involved in cell wall biosynthesis
MSICLCMIVKNESKVIVETLTHLWERFPFSYWVISDTGSTDNTKELILDFFKDKLKGELIENEWKDFAYNRNMVLECAYMKTDYLMMFDADDSIVGTMILPHLKEDRYVATFGNHESYYRPLLVTNRKKWIYKGVLHEYLDAPEIRTTGILKGNYYVNSGRIGARNQNPHKYSEDASLLEKAFHEETDEGLKDRYAFYCAQSHMDAKHILQSITWYKITIHRKGWNQERYCASLQLGKLYACQQQMDQALHAWRTSIQIDPERIEGLVMAATYAQKYGNHALVNTLYHQCKGYKKQPFNKLFLQPQLYQYEIEYLNAWSAYFTADPSSGYACCKDIIQHQRNKNRVVQCIRWLKRYTIFLNKDGEFNRYLHVTVPKDVLAQLL